MPSPPPQQPTDAQPQQPTAAQIALHAAELYALEQLAARVVAAPLRSRLIRIQRRAATAWITAFGSLGADADPIRQGQIIATISRELAAVPTGIGKPLRDYADRALALGITQAGREVGVDTGGINAGLDDATLRAVAGLNAAVAGRIADAEAALNTAGPAFADVASALAHAHRAASDAQAATVQTVNGAANTGIAAVADALDAQRLLIAEPDACLTCLGLSGRLADPGQPFDAAHAAAFTAKPRIWPPGPIYSPPIHPHCRCRTAVWRGSVAGGTDLPSALRREAQRSVLKGWSLPSESGPERVRAAQQLLNRGVNAPAAVQAYARAAVRRGKFTTRAVPIPPRRSPSTR